MSTNAGTLQIEIATNVARIKADMAEAKNLIGTAMKDVEQYVGYAKTAFIGLGGVLTIDAFEGLINGAITTKVKLYDLSLQTGISVEALSGLGKIAKFSHTELTDIAGASNKLSKALFTQNEDSKGAAQALKALGINFSEFKRLGADEQFVTVAKAMGKFEDGTQKSAVAMLLYGKNGATLLAFLKELEERGYSVGKQTTESALQAKKYEDNIITLKAAASAWQRELAEAVLPTLISVTDSMVDARKEADKFNLVGEALKITLQTLAVVGANVSFVFQGVGREIGAIAAQAAAVAQGNFAGAAAIREAVIDDGKRARADLDATEQRLMGLKSKIGTAADFQRGDKDTSPVARKRLGLDAALPGTGRAAADPYDALILGLRKKLELESMELEMGRALTAGEKEALDVMVQVREGKIKLNGVRAAEVSLVLEQRIANEKLNDERDREIKWMQEANGLNATYIEHQMQLRDSLQSVTRAAEDQLAAYGLTTDELRALESARLRNSAALLQEKAALADDAYLEDNARLYREQAAALNATADARDKLAAKEARDRNDPVSGAERAVKEYLDDVKRAGDATYGAVANSLKGLEDLTVTALSGGDAKSAAKAWVSGILAEVNRLYIVKPLMAELFGSAGGSGGAGGGLLAGLIGTAASYFGGSYDANYSHEGMNFGGPRAAGGPVDAGKNYLVGERGPEILRMGSQAGTVIPNGAGSGSRPVTVNVTNNGQAVQARSSQRETSEGTVIELMLEAVAADMAGGGKVHDATQRRFGLNPGGTTPRY